jgi:hypothetical protein
VFDWQAAATANAAIAASATTRIAMSRTMPRHSKAVNPGIRPERLLGIWPDRGDSLDGGHGRGPGGVGSFVTRGRMAPNLDLPSRSCTLTVGDQLAEAALTPGHDREARYHRLVDRLEAARG